MKKFLPFFLPFASFALPQGGEVSGEVEITRLAKELHVTTGAPRAAIDWKSFSIAQDEAVRFMQPSADSAVLNNVISGSISHLMGTLESNGHVYIVNPNGIIIGKDALINVHSLIASTLKITNEDFLAGNNHFTGAEKSKVINLGTLRANGGDIHVISYQIDNRGAIEANEGKVTLTAAREAWLQSKERGVLIKTTLGEESQESGITNSGTITALQTQLDADGSLYKFAINHSGHIEAKVLSTENGRVYLRAENGCAVVTGTITAPGGHVEALAERVIIDEEAKIDVSHGKRGGAILIGGDWHGENTPFRADHAYLGPRAELRSDGLGHGSGGRVILWGDLSSRAFGRMSACGGALGGDGGNIEISRVPLLATKHIYTNAPNGKTGTLLLDPRNVTISSDTQDANVTLGDPTTYTGSNDPVVINGSNLVSALDAANVEIDASGLNGGTSDGNITVEESFTWASTNTLTLAASPTGTVQINKTISCSSVGDLILRGKSILVGKEDHSITSGTYVDSQGGDISIEFNGAGGKFGIYSGDGAGDTAPASVITKAALTIGRASGYTGALGDIEIISTTGSAATVESQSGGDISIEANTITINSTGSSTAYLSTDTGGDININWGSPADTGDIAVTNSGTGQAYIYATDGTLRINGPGNITVTKSGSGSAYIEADESILLGGEVSDSRKAVGAITITSNADLGSAFIRSNNDDMTVLSSGAINISLTNDGRNAYMQSVNASFTIPSSQSITLSNSSSQANAEPHISSGSGDIVLVANGSIRLADDAQILANDPMSSVIIACDQASDSPGGGHIDISSGSEITAGASGKLRIFCGYFENNTISTSADLNGGTFSGVADVPDANNIYGVVYNPSSLPTQYTAPYTFYYKATTEELEQANVLLASTMVSSSTLSGDSAYTLLDERSRGYFGHPVDRDDQKYKSKSDEGADHESDNEPGQEDNQQSEQGDQ